MPLSELQNEPDEWAKLGLDAVNATAAKYAKPDGTMMLLVGDKSKIEVGIRELNLGEIIFLDAEENVVK